MLYEYRDIDEMVHQSTFYDHLNQLHGILISDIKVAAMVLSAHNNQTTPTYLTEIQQQFNLTHTMLEEIITRLEMCDYILLQGNLVRPGFKLLDQQDPLAAFLHNMKFTE